nr:TFIIB related factor hBRF [Cryptomonas curvata]
MKCEKCGNEDIKYEFTAGKITCNFCGFIIEECILNPDISFNQSDLSKVTANGHLIVSNNEKKSNFMNKSTEFIFISAKRKINQLGNSLKLCSKFQDSAFRLFMFASHKGVVQGRKIQALCISCIYVVCRRERMPHLLVDFSDITQTRSSKIGAIFLKFIRNLNITLPVIDPSLFVHRFAFSLQFGNKTNMIARSALRLIARMKRDWMATGRRPSGLCGAALLIASRMHGVKRTQKEIGDIVRIGNIVLRSRLREIDKTSISNLTIYEIDKGGGDDGNRESLYDNFNSVVSQPPSREEINAYLNESKEKSNYLSKPENENLISERMKIIANPLFNKIKNNQPNQDILKYLNTNLEIHIKKEVWTESNLNFIHSQSILARAQKEKPFAFFRMGKKFKIKISR